MHISRKDVLSPANAISLIGCILTIYGAMTLTSWTGLSLAALGRGLDLLDGYVARRTHTSRFGAVLDATLDKISMLALLIAVLAFGTAPLFVALFILLQNGLVSILNLVSSHRKIVVQSTRNGKYNAFLQVLTLLIFTLSYVSDSLHLISLATATIVFAVSIYFSIRATADYASHHKSS